MPFVFWVLQEQCCGQERKSAAAAADNASSNLRAERHCHECFRCKSTDTSAFFVRAVTRAHIDGVDADIDDSGPLLDPVTGHHLSFATCRDDNIRLRAHFLGIRGARVYHGHGGIPILQQQRSRQAHDVAAADDTRCLSLHPGATVHPSP